MQRKIASTLKRLAEATDPNQRRAIQTEIPLLATRKAIEMVRFAPYRYPFVLQYI